jgi:alkylation response protein AidB-like acyl-CoA dehydrogenase
VLVPPAQVCRPWENTAESVFTLHGPLGATAILAGVARRAFADMVAYASTRARPWPLAGVERAADDPYVLHRVGRLRTLVDATDVLLERALAALDAAVERPSAEARALASVATSQARAFATTAGLELTGELFQVCGASSTLRSFDLDRHWRNLRTLSLNEPIDYRLRLVGDYWVNGTRPPNTPFS